MKCNYSITFEFDTASPITVKGEAEATSVRTIAARALDDATERNPNLKWSSLVILIDRKEKEPIKEKEE